MSVVRVIAGLACALVLQVLLGRFSADLSKLTTGITRTYFSHAEAQRAADILPRTGGR